MMSLVADKSKQRQLWDQIRRMNEIRSLFNSILLQKFRMLPRIYKRNQQMLKLFNDTLLDMSAANQEESNHKSIEVKSKDEL